MAYYITNGFYFITLGPTGAIKKTTGQEEASSFTLSIDAEEIIKKAPAKTKGYSIIPMDESSGEDNEAAESSGSTGKRKKLTPSMRKVVYAKDHGRCYICGKVVDPDSFEVEHKVPVAKGGTNDLNNLYVACHICNTMKNSMIFEDFMQKISEIASYQLADTVREECAAVGA